MQKVTTLLALCVFLAGSTFAGRNLKNIKPRVPIIDDGIERTAPVSTGRYIPGLDKPASLNWVAVDEMANAFGPANDVIKPIAYDPTTNVIALIHRGASPYALGSGQLWYNVSHDAGLSWRRVGELNGGSPISCRYPSVAISNPNGVNDTDQCLLVYSCPNLENGGAFGQITYGADFPLGGGNGFGTVDVGSNLYTAATTIWAERANPWIIWASTELGSGIPNNSTNWRTNDYISVPRTTPPTWRDTLPNFINSLGFVVGSANASGSYFCVNGLFGGDDSAYAFNDGYCKSTDHGATWGPWIRPQPDWMQATGLPLSLDLYDYYQADGPGTTVSYTSDMLVDGNDRVHFFLAIADSPWTAHANRHLIEIYETGSGWSYKWIKQNLNTYTGLGYPGVVSGTTYLDQTNNAQQASISADGQVMTLVWLDAATSAPADSFPDIWFSYRKITDTQWSTPVNLTQTPNFPELLLHAAPTLKQNGPDSYTLFIGRSYQSGINTYPPDNGLPTTFFVSPYTFSTTGTTSINVSVGTGWNMISNPVTNAVPDDSAKHLFPTITSRVFRFSGGYVVGDVMNNGVGYWGKFPGAVVQPITGLPRTRDSISVVAGWNMIGSISNPVDTNTITSVPAGIRSSNWFGFSGGYAPVSQIVPGKAYWVKASAAGKFVFANPPANRPAGQSSAAAETDILNSITITDNNGGSQTLYFGADANKSIPVAMYVMPPAPPQGAFDARFETAEGGSMVQTYAEGGAHEFSVKVQSEAYPLTVTWKMKDAEYELVAGGAVQTMRGEGSMKVAGADVQRIELRLTSDGQLPKEYAMSQNYPNPFNPTTNITYALPVESKVTMEVYNVLGQKVATLVSDTKAAGYHVAEWNGASFGSGVYFVRINAEGATRKFSDVKKLMMVK